MGSQIGFVDVDSLQAVIDSTKHAGKPWAVPIFPTSTRVAIGGRYILVDTIQVSITSAVEYDRDHGQYRYSYVLGNDENSQGRIEWFELRGVSGPISDITSADDWGILVTPNRPLMRVIWVPKTPSPPPPGWVADRVSVYPSAYCVDPGESLSGFGFLSNHPPGEITFRVEAYEPIRPVEEESPFDRPFEAYGKTQAVSWTAIEGHRDMTAEEPLASTSSGFLSGFLFVLGGLMYVIIGVLTLAIFYLDTIWPDAGNSDPGFMFMIHILPAAILGGCLGRRWLLGLLALWGLLLGSAFGMLASSIPLDEYLMTRGVIILATLIAVMAGLWGGARVRGLYEAGNTSEAS
jgi:hypothetical protein